MAYLKRGQLPVRESRWVCQSDVGVVGVFLAVLQPDSDVHQLIYANSNLCRTFRETKRMRREFVKIKNGREDNKDEAKRLFIVHVFVK